MCDAALLALVSFMSQPLEPCSGTHHHPVIRRIQTRCQHGLLVSTAAASAVAGSLISKLAPLTNFDNKSTRTAHSEKISEEEIGKVS